MAYILITTSVKDAFENLGDYIDYDIEMIGNVWEDSDLLNDSENTKIKSFFRENNYDDSDLPF